MNSSNCEQPADALVLIEYPGVVKNLSKALDTLGGLPQISQSHFAKRSLELRHTPNNPYTSCLVSERKGDGNHSNSGTLRLVMRIRRNKKNPKLIKTEFLGQVSYTYTFDSMCDFQYLPLKKKTNGEDCFDDLIPRLIPSDLQSALCWWERADSHPTPLFLPPFQFSRYTTPSTKILARETDFGADKSRKVKKVGYGQNLRVERRALSVTVHAKEPFPKEPTKEAIEDANFRCKYEEPHRLLAELFDERPMWTRVAILYRTRLDDTLLKYILQKYAFYILSGPWGRLWCRFGYDPRLDPQAAQYQTLMVSFRQHMKIPERQRLKVSLDRPAAAVANPTAANPAVAPAHEPISFLYEKGKLPRVRQMWYCLMDIHLSDAENLFEENILHIPKEKDDVDTDGWISLSEVEKIRLAIKDDVRNTSIGIDFAEDNDGEPIEDF